MGKQAPKGAGLATEADEASSGRNRADLRRGYGRIEGGHALASGDAAVIVLQRTATGRKGTRLQNG